MKNPIKTQALFENLKKSYLEKREADIKWNNALNELNESPKEDKAWIHNAFANWIEKQ